MTIQETATKYTTESAAYQRWLATLPEDDALEADYMYQEGVSFEELQVTFK